jgi:hypothetical protein
MICRSHSAEQNVKLSATLSAHAETIRFSYTFGNTGTVAESIVFGCTCRIQNVMLSAQWKAQLNLLVSAAHSIKLKLQLNLLLSTRLKSQRNSLLSATFSGGLKAKNSTTYSAKFYLQLKLIHSETFSAT